MMAVDPIQLKGETKEKEKSEELLHPAPQKEASAAQNYEERAKEQRIARFLELQKYLHDRQLRKSLRLIFAIQNELDLNIIEKEIQQLESEIAALEGQLSENQNIEPQIQERKKLLCSILREKLEKLELRRRFLETVYQNSPPSPEKTEWLQNQKLDIHQQTSVKIPEKIEQFGGIAKPEYQTICTPERRKQELEEILIKEKSLVLKITLRTLCIELLCIRFPASQKGKELTYVQKQAFEAIKEIATSIKESEWVELQSNVDDYIARLQEAANKLPDGSHLKSINLHVVIKAKELYSALLKLKNPEEEMKDEKKEIQPWTAPQENQKRSGCSNAVENPFSSKIISSSSSSAINSSAQRIYEQAYSDSETESSPALFRKETTQTIDSRSSSFNSTFVMRAAGVIGGCLDALSAEKNAFQQANPTAYNVICIAGAVTLGLALCAAIVGISVLSAGAAPTALAFVAAGHAIAHAGVATGTAIAAHPGWSIGVGSGILGISALGTALFFGKECHKKRETYPFEQLSNSNHN